MGKRYRGGFTLIELSLSLIFIAILSLAVVFLIQNLTASYRRGLILNQVNTVGMDLIDDFRISVQNANAEPITKMCERMYVEGSTDRTNCIDNNANSFVSATRYGNVTVNGTTRNMPIYGAFCTGTYTYIWNTGYFEQPSVYADVYTRSVSPNTPAVLGIKDSSNTNFTDLPNNSGKDFRLIKIYDESRSVCVNAMMKQNSWNASYKNIKTNTVNNQFMIDRDMYNNALAIDNGPIRLLEQDGQYSDLAIYELYVAEPALSATRQNMFYAASFILGTLRGGIDIKTTGSSCKPPNDDYTEIDYCAINKFNFAVTAGGY